MISIIHQLRLASGSLAKQKVLRQHKDNQLWQQYLVAVYDTSINYGVSPPNDATFVDDVHVPDLLSALEELAAMPGGNAKRDFANTCSLHYGELFRLALGGSIRAGVTATTINKIMPGLIREFKVMLAKEVENPKYPLLASLKYDGVRLVAFVKENGFVTLKTRAGKTLDFIALRQQMSLCPPGVYDGELVSGDGLQAGRTKITGQVNRVLKGTDRHISDCSFWIFDRLSLEEWQTRDDTLPYEQRFDLLCASVPESNFVKVAQQTLMQDQASVDQMYAHAVHRGFEGLILRSQHDPYVWKRSQMLIKMKATNECVLHCVGLLEGKGKYTGMIGALLCEGQIKGKHISVKVGSGLSDWDRAKSAQEFVNKAIEILYNDIVLAEGETAYSLFLPRFKRVRGDYNI